MRLFFLLSSLLCSVSLFSEGDIHEACVSNYYCNECVPRTRADNIPQTHVIGMCDEYMTGYIQALVDMHYYEFQIRIIAHQGTVFVFNLPNNYLISNSILCFIYDVPCIECVECVTCCPDEFIEELSSYDSQAAEDICHSEAYQSMCQMPLPPCQIQGIWMPQNTVLFQPLIADPRQVINSAALRFNDDVIGKHVGAVSFGNDFIALRLKDVLRWHGDMDLGVQAGIFSVFDLDNPKAAFVNTDFFVAAMMTYAVNRSSFRFRLWHMSSHLGDEFMISNPHVLRRNLSDNGIDAFASYQLGRYIRVYGGLGYIMMRDREFPEKPFYMEWGGEIRVFGGRDCFNRLYLQPFLAMHFRSWAEHDYSVDQTYALGLEWSKLQGVGQKFRFFLEYHDGFSVEGQFVRDRSNYLALKVQYGF